VSDQQVTLLPGDTIDFAIRHAAPLDAVALVQPPVLRVASTFGNNSRSA
jgi:hypothetical protein